MKNKKILSGILIIIGIGIYIFGSYISSEVSQGRKKISSAQKKVDKAHGLSKLSPYTKDIGDMAAASGQKKIDEGKKEADKYQVLANWLHGSGISIFVIGIGLLGFSFIRKKSS